METTPDQAPTDFRVTSQTLPAGSRIQGEQLAPELGGSSTSPDLTWHGAPEGTKSFAVTCFDPDAPTGSGFWHWVAWDIPANTTSLSLGVARDDTSIKQAVNDFGRRGFDGPNPPPGPAHRYIFTVHALPVETLGADPDDPHVGTRFKIFTQQLESTGLTASYGVSTKKS